jgi:hypothetical protein
MQGQRPHQTQRLVESNRHVVKHGGKRKGAGRKPRPDAVVTASISLRPQDWQRLDQLRGEESRSAWVRKKVRES